MSYHTRVDEFLCSTEYEHWAPQAKEVRAVVHSLMNLVYTPSQVVVVNQPTHFDAPNLFPLQTHLEGFAGNVAFSYCRDTCELAIGFGWGRGVTDVKIFTPLN